MPINDQLKYDEKIVRRIVGEKNDLLTLLKIKTDVFKFNFSAFFSAILHTVAEYVLIEFLFMCIPNCRYANKENT